MHLSSLGRVYNKAMSLTWADRILTKILASPNIELNMIKQNLIWSKSSVSVGIFVSLIEQLFVSFVALYYQMLVKIISHQVIVLRRVSDNEIFSCDHREEGGDMVSEPVATDKDAAHRGSHRLRYLGRC